MKNENKSADDTQEGTEDERREDPELQSRQVRARAEALKGRSQIKSKRDGDLEGVQKRGDCRRKCDAVCRGRESKGGILSGRGLIAR